MEETLIPLLSSGSVPGLLAAIIVMLGVHLFTSTGRFLWSLKEKKDALSEQTVKDFSLSLDHYTVVAEKLDDRIRKLEASIDEFSKHKGDLKRLFLAVKLLAGESWPTIRKEILEEEEATRQ